MPHGNGHEGETVRRLLESAAAEFARHGFAAARIRDIVDAAGVNLAAVNYHFGGKEGLYQATLELLVRRTQAELPREAAEVRRLPAEEQLRILTRVALGRLLDGAQSSPIARILAHEMLDPTPAFDGLMRDVAGPQFDWLTHIVARLLGPAANADEVSLASFSVIGQWALYLYGRVALERGHSHLLRGPAAIDRLARQVADFSVAAVLARRLEIETRLRQTSPSAPAKPMPDRGIPPRPPAQRRAATKARAK
jgi:AcrR family transcriptional regulator